MIPKKFFTILHSQFNYHTLPVTPFKKDYDGVITETHAKKLMVVYQTYHSVTVPLITIF